jgi:sugar/nucleoside kinase (ribokinase family)
MNRPRVLFVGRATLDALYWLDQLPEEDTKIFARQFQAAPGGPALNAAITHSLLGGEAMLVSAVGGGPWAIPVRAELEKRGISLFDLAADTAYETPLTTVLVNSANSSRTIVNPPVVPVELRQRRCPPPGVQFPLSSYATASIFSRCCPFLPPAGTRAPRSAWTAAVGSPEQRN